MRSFALSVALACAAAAAGRAPPRVVIMQVVDDLGWGDVGFHRAVPTPENDTPNIDALAASGIILDRQYVFSQCTPSRSSVLSGRLPVHVYRYLENPEIPHAGIPRNMTTLPALMRAGGYSTHAVGKWDVGMSTPSHTPEGRGFDSSLIYFEHKNDYWTQQLAQSACMTAVDEPIVDLWSNGAPATTLNGTNYEEYIFRDRILSILSSYNASSDKPLFLYWASHAAHCPLQVPRDVLATYAALTAGTDETLCQEQTASIFPGSTAADYSCRAQYEGLVGILDGEVGLVSALLKQKGLWSDTLWAFTSDNGGPVGLAESGSNNFPLKGGKYSDWEGGIRAAAFVSGGWLDASVRGTTSEGLMHIADWSATFAALANVSTFDPVAAAAGLPQPDGISMLPLLSAPNASSPRASLVISTNTIIEGRYKLVRGVQSSAAWSGPTFPNASSSAQPIETVTHNCNAGGGCLFDVVGDKSEYTDLAAAEPARLAAMNAALLAASARFFSNNDTGVDICPHGIAIPCACWAALHVHGGYFGPYQH